MAGNHNKQPVDTDHTLVHDCTDLNQGGNLIFNFINVQDRITLIRDKSVDFQPLDTVVDRNKFRGSNLCLKLMGYVTLIAHHWRDKAYLKKNITCNHQDLCSCKKILLADRQFDRPFVQLPIGDPQMMNHQTNHDCRNHSFIKPSAKDEENLIRVGLLVSTKSQMTALHHHPSPPIWISIQSAKSVLIIEYVKLTLEDLSDIRLH